MLEWLYRGLSKRRVTTRYPASPEHPPAGFAGSIEVLHETAASAELAEVCPTGAITVEDGRLSLDQARCILCGECVRAAPERFAFARRYESARRSRAALVVGDVRDGAPESSSGAALGERGPMLRRSIHVRHIDCGSDGSEEWEIQALWNPYYDIQRLGFFLTAAPRHADILLATGGVTGPMRGPLERTWDEMPDPKALVAVGTDACSGGLAADGGLVAGGIDQVLPVDVYVPGSPPAPIAVMQGLLLAVGLLGEAEVPV
jgi:Ni,Fe-hydrogenase III small subunit/ferredoxin